MDRAEGDRTFVGAPPRPSWTRQNIPKPPGSVAGPPAPWYDLATDRMRFTSADVEAAFADVGPPSLSPREHARDRLGAAVLAVVYDDGGEAWVILTRRTVELRSHSGEVSFPGGRQEPGETFEQTARRETIEEISLAQAPRLVGEIDHLSTITSQSVIVPYVGVVEQPPWNLKPNPGEVDAILQVPLSRLLDPSIYRSEIWQLPGGIEHPIFFFDLAEDTVWGATAALLRQLLGFLTGTVGRGELGHI